MRRIATALAAVAPFAMASDAPAIAPFSSAAAGAPLPAPWRELRLPRIDAPRFALVADGGTTVLQARSRHAAGTVAHPLHADAARSPWLAWRWKVDRVVAGADLASRAGDDFAARVYVFFDVPLAELPWGARLKLALARLLHGDALPSTAICYVWDNRHPSGYSAWSPYTERVRVIVLESGESRAGQWVEESRDVAADFRAAFGPRVAPISGIAAGNDTDQTGESVTAWFGDFRLEARS